MGGQGGIKSASSHEENAWSRHQRLFEENVRKTKKGKGLWILNEQGTVAINLLCKT